MKTSAFLQPPGTLPPTTQTFTVGTPTPPPTTHPHTVGTLTQTTQPNKRLPQEIIDFLIQQVEGGTVVWNNSSDSCPRCTK